MADQQALLRITYQASAATWPFTAISSTLFGMRVFSRVHLRKTAVGRDAVGWDAVGWDDLVLSVSWILDIVRAAVFQKALDSTKQITPENLPETVPTAAFWVIFIDAWAYLSIALPKLGVGILIIRIFNPQRWLKVTIMTLCVALNILAVIGFIITFVQCNPAVGQWDPFRYPQTRCWNRAVGLLYACTVSGISAFMDIAFAVYPGIVVWGLQMPTWKKFSATALMGLGLVSFAFAVIKLTSNTTLLGSPDINKLLYDGIHIGLWNSIENDFVLSAACLPSVPPFFRACKLFMRTHVTSFSRRTHPSSFGSFKSSSRSGGQEDNQAMELAHNGVLPGTSGVGNKHWGQLTDPA